MQEQFLRIQMLFGESAMAALRRSHVAVFGLGGVGSYAVEALVRSGVGELTLVDDDAVSVSNLNRQLEALHSTVGQSKAEAMAARCRAAMPELYFLKTEIAAAVSTGEAQSEAIRTTERVCLGVLAAMLALRAKRGEDCGALARELLSLFAAREEYRACAEKLAAAWDDGTILDFYA